MIPILMKSVTYNFSVQIWKSLSVVKKILIDSNNLTYIRTSKKGQFSKMNKKIEPYNFNKTFLLDAPSSLVSCGTVRYAEFSPSMSFYRLIKKKKLASMF